MQAFTAPGFSRTRGEQLTKELMYEVMARASAAAQLDKLWADTFLTNAGINSGTSTGYTYRGSANFDVIVNAGGIRESATTEDDLIELMSNIAASERGACQSFTASASYTLASVTVKMIRLGSPTGNLRLAIYAESGNLPTGAALATSPDLSVATIATSYTEYTFTLSTPLALTNGTKYVLAIERNGAYTGDGANHINIRVSASSVYAGGQAGQKSNTDVWSAVAAKDMYFKTNEAAASTAVVKSVTITMPSAITSVLLHANVTGGPASLYRVSTNGGGAWTTIASADVATSTSDGNIVTVPSGTSVIIEITLTGSMELESWGIAGS